MKHSQDSPVHPLASAGREEDASSSHVLRGANPSHRDTRYNAVLGGSEGSSHHWSGKTGSAKTLEAYAEEERRGWEDPVMS